MNPPPDGERVISGRSFDEPLILTGNIAEPERYVAEKPYELTKYEFSVLKKRTVGDLGFQVSLGATAGVFLSVTGKILSSLLGKKPQTLEVWEIVCIVIGILLCVVFKKMVKTKDDREKEELEQVIDNHFITNKPRRVHLTQGGSSNEN